ncbi:fatty acid synthase-like isoform X2 [Haemaphysalis longicornis]
MSDDDIVISGFSARFPQTDSLNEFGEKLYRGDDFITDDDTRWPRGGFMAIPKRVGKIRDLRKFDAQFFGVLPRQAEVMDPQLRLLLETSYEAIIDAGYDPAALRGRKIGVFVGCSISETGCAMLESAPDDARGYAMLGSCLSMLSNRISYSFDFHGPSETVDTACSSTMTALNHAVLAIRAGRCEAAIVGGSNLILNPATSAALCRLTMLSKEGKCKVFDADADGYVRSDTVGAIFLQVASKARRVYSKLVHISANSDGYKTEGITSPSGKMQEKLFRDVYAEAKVKPQEVCYVEVHGTGTKVGDPEEVGAISNFFCRSPRESPLMIGSVKSNVGHAEAASGICSIAKVILALETGTIAGNLHFTKPNPDIPSLLDGTIEVVDHHKSLAGAMVGINSFGFGGANVHAILQAKLGPHVKSLPRLKPDLPRLVLMAGRNADALARTLEILEAEAPHPDSTYALLNEVGQPNVKQFPFRGFAVVPTSGDCKALVKGNPEEAPLKRKPLWFIFTGIGCQWNGMALQMMQFDVFARSIHQSNEVLKQFNFDLIGLVTSEDNDTQSVLSAFVSISAVQVALVDLLTAVGVRPDGFLGHSLGEIGCGYADGALSAEQAVLCAYWRGRCLELGNVPKGAMAVVGLPWSEAESRCRDGVVPACHNSEDYVTVSGLADPVARLVEELKAENVFVSEVNSANMALHSPYIRSVGPALREALKQVIEEPKLRSSHWVSSSVPESSWQEPIAQRCSADYLVNNFLSPVLFYKALQHVPREAIVIEIAPHSMLKGILRGVLGQATTCLGLMKSDSDNKTLFLRTLGQLHVLGVQLELRSLYPPVAWPVPRGTPSIAHYVSWDHSQSWNVVGWHDFLNKPKVSEKVVEVDLMANENDVYLTERKLNGQVVFPAAAYMVLAWKRLTADCAKPFDQVPVIFENVTLHQNVILPTSGKVRLLVNVMHESGEFRVSNDDNAVATGRIRTAEEDLKFFNVGTPCTPQGGVVYELDAEDVYKELRLRGYECNGVLQGIVKADLQFQHGKLKWEDNWVTFMDAMLQFVALNDHLRTSTLPRRIEYCSVDPHVQERIIANVGDAGVDVVYERYLNTCSAAGMVIRNVVFSPTLPSRESQVPLLEECHFVPYFNSDSDIQQRQASVQDYVEICSVITRRILDLCHSNDTHALHMTNEFPGASAKSLHYFPDNPAENHGLLRTLNTILNCVKDSPSSLVTSVRSAISGHKKDLEEDLLNTALLAEDPLRYLLDVVSENSFGNKLKILELGLEKFSLLLAPRVLSLCSITNPVLKTDYSAAHAFPVCANTEEHSESIKMTDFESVFSLEGELHEAHLIVARVHAGDFIELSALSRKLSRYCSRYAFVLISMRTALTPAELFLKRVNETPLEVPTCEAAQAAFECNGFCLVAQKSNGWSSLMLFRMCPPPLESATQEIINVDSSSYDWVETLKEKAFNCESGPPGQTLWLLDENDGIGGTVGLMKCLRQESVGRRIRCIFDASHGGCKKLSNVSPSNPEYAHVFSKDLVMNVYSHGQWGSYMHNRVQPSDAPKKTTKFAYISMTPGDLSSVKWHESSLPYRSPCPPQNTARLLCSVYYVPLTSRDLMIGNREHWCNALPGGLANSDSVLGIEFSGRDPSGRRVMGLVASGAMATVVSADPDFLWEVPAAWSLREASTVPAVYSTAYYALLLRGNLRAGETILVHAGSSDVGQAAISIALSMGCTVFTTVDSVEKHEFLKSHFPELEERHIVISKDTSFERHLLLETDGKGVNLVLNVLADVNLRATLRCVAPHGRFLDITCFDRLFDDVSLQKSTLPKNVTFHNISPDALFSDDTSGAPVKSRIAQLIRGGITSGAVRPLHTTVYRLEEVQEAFRFVASASHIGKVVLEVRPEESDRNVVPATLLTVEAVAHTWFYEDKSYVIIGGLGGVGLELADWMVSRGCRKLLLCSRSGVQSGYQRLCLNHWKRAGAEVLVSTADTSTEDGAREIIQKSLILGTVGGIFNLAVVPGNGLLENQSTTAYKTIVKTKVDVTQRLDDLARNLCPELDHFVVFSSVACGRGIGGETSYGYANSAIERICERRVADGFPALAIQWGPIADVGIFHETMGSDAEVHGMVPQRIASCLEVLDRFLCCQKGPVVSCLVKSDQSFKPRIQEKQDLVQATADIIGMKEWSTFNSHVTLGELGLDSLMGFKVQEAIELHCGLVLSMREIRQLTMKHLEDMARENTPASKNSTTELERKAPKDQSNMSA